MAGWGTCRFEGCYVSDGCGERGTPSHKTAEKSYQLMQTLIPVIGSFTVYYFHAHLIQTTHMLCAMFDNDMIKCTYTIC